MTPLNATESTGDAAGSEPGRDRPRNLLHIDASPRPGIAGVDPHGSQTRRLGRRFVERWHSLRPRDRVTYRDVGQHPPAPVTAAWLSAVFTPAAYRDPQARAELAESDALIAELVQADIVVMGVPMYNFGIPAQLKAWIDNVVRVGVTVAFEPTRGGNYYVPLLPGGKSLVILCSRGDHGYGGGERLGGKNLVDHSIALPMAQIGLTDLHAVAAEYGQFSDERSARAIGDAERAIDRLVSGLSRT